MANDTEKKINLTDSSKPSKSPHKFTKPKKRAKIESAKSVTGEVFKVGDEIEVKAMGRKTLYGVIDYFYKDVSGDTWAVYKPVKDDSEFPWKSGCIRQALLIGAKK